MKNSTLPIRKSVAALAAAFGALLVVPAADVAAQQQPAERRAQSAATNAQQGGTQTMQNARQMRASKVLGLNVRNAKGEDLGHVKDLIIDTNSQRVRYAVLSSGGFLGVGDKLFAYPVQAFQTSADRDDLVLNVDRERLRDLPGFDTNAWPADLGGYAGSVDRFFARLGIGDNRGTVTRNDGDAVGRNDGDPRPDSITRNDAAGSPPAARGTTQREQAANAQGTSRAGTTRGDDIARNPNLQRASWLIGRNINDAGNRNAGEIEDLVVSMADGRVRAVVVDFDKAWSPDDKMLMLPMSAFRFGGGKDQQPVLTLARDRIDMKRGFDDNAWPDLNDARWRADNDRWIAGVDGDVRSGASAAGAGAAAAAGAAGERIRDGARAAGNAVREGARETREAVREGTRETREAARETREGARETTNR